MALHATPAERVELTASTVKALPPAYFSVVMATGIVALACYYELHAPWLAKALTVLNLGIFGALAALLIIRFVLYRRQFLEDFHDFDRGPGFFTVVAAAAISMQFRAYRAEILFFALTLRLAGSMLYLWLIALIFYRFTFFPFRPRDFIRPAIFWPPCSLSWKASQCFSGRLRVGGSRCWRSWHIGSTSSNGWAEPTGSCIGMSCSRSQCTPYALINWQRSCV
jgi:tellurite resistance protein TehA-like permease